jgi:hypothetical protein
LLRLAQSTEEELGDPFARFDRTCRLQNGCYKT